MEEEKYSVSICRDFPDGVPLIEYAHSRKDAIAILKRLTAKDYQSSQVKTKPGYRNIALIERWNPKDNDWEFIGDDEIGE